MVDRLLLDMGEERRVARTVASFFSAPHLLPNTDYILTLRRRMAMHAQRALPLVTKTLPLQVPDFQLSALWHARTDSDAAQRWLRQQLVHVMQSLP